MKISNHKLMSENKFLKQKIKELTLEKRNLEQEQIIIKNHAMGMLPAFYPCKFCQKLNDLKSMQMLPSIFYQQSDEPCEHTKSDDQASNQSELLSSQTSEPKQFVLQRRPKKQFGFALLTIMFALMLTHCDFSSLEHRKFTLSIETQAGYLTTFYQIFDPFMGKTEGAET